MTSLRNPTENCLPPSPSRNRQAHPNGGFPFSSPLNQPEKDTLTSKTRAVVLAIRKLTILQDLCCALFGAKVPDNSLDLEGVSTHKCILVERPWHEHTRLKVLKIQVEHFDVPHVSLLKGSIVGSSRRHLLLFGFMLKFCRALELSSSAACPFLRPALVSNLRGILCWTDGSCAGFAITVFCKLTLPSSQTHAYNKPQSLHAPGEHVNPRSLQRSVR